MGTVVVVGKYVNNMYKYSNKLKTLILYYNVYSHLFVCQEIISDLQTCLMKYIGNILLFMATDTTYKRLKYLNRQVSHVSFPKTAKTS